LETKVLPCSQENILQAARLIQKGKLIAFPTETVYGLGGDGLNPKAVKAIFEAKGRPQDNPLILHVDTLEKAKDICHFHETADTLAKAFWPGPLTLILPKKPIVPAAVTAGLTSVAVRCPEHPAALRLLKACSNPVAAPSANVSGRPSPTTARHVFEDLNGKIPLILDGGACTFGLESTVLDLTGAVPTVLRPGAVTPQQIAMVVGACDVAASVMRPLEEGEAAPSPGMKHRHYAPKGRMLLVNGMPEKVAEEICRRYDQKERACILAFEPNLAYYGDRRVQSLGEDAKSAAHLLFYLLRKMDEEKVQLILCETLPQTGFALAVMNRMARAASFQIINV
jgi:L-threonylcarbamoyladenylate synthase